MPEDPKHKNPALASDDNLAKNVGLLGTKNPEAKELSRDEFLRMAKLLNFNERELATLSALYHDDIKSTALLDNFEPSIRY